MILSFQTSQYLPLGSSNILTETDLLFIVAFLAPANLTEVKAMILSISSSLSFHLSLSLFIDQQPSFSPHHHQVRLCLLMLSR